MTREYLKNARETGRRLETTTTEAELIVDNEGIREAWLEIQRIKKMISDKQIEAAANVAAEFQQELDNAVGDYALLLSLSR
jgi:hypothetical protein